MNTDLRKKQQKKKKKKKIYEKDFLKFFNY